MQPDVTVGGWVIPGFALTAAAAIGSAIWAWISSRRIKTYESTLRQREIAIESRFNQQNEAFRLAHSPRVSGAVKLWASFCEFERCLRAQLSPMRVYSIPKDTAREEADRVKEELRLKQERSIREATATAWGTLKVARDEAEVLLPGPVFAKFDQLFRCFYDAHGEQWVAELASDPGSHRELAQAHLKIGELLKEGDKLRPNVVTALRATIEGPYAPGDEVRAARQA